jgi:plastocyanin
MCIRRLVTVGVGGFIILLLTSVSIAIGYEAITVQNGGSIVGTVTYTGELPTLEKVDISKDQEICGKTEKINETLVVGKKRGLQNVVVSIVDIEKGKPFAETIAVLDQRDCRYAPHVVLVPIATPLTILNNDGILHSVRTQSSKNPAFHKAQSKFKKEMSETFDQPEVIQVSCDVHSWMKGWIIVEQHPYFTVTDKDGQFRLTDIPTGKYQLQFWHELLGNQDATVIVQKGEESRREISFTPRP